MEAGGQLAADGCNAVIICSTLQPMTGHLPAAAVILCAHATRPVAQAVTRCTALRALSVGSAFGVAANSVLKKLTLLTALEIGEQLPSSQQGTLAGGAGRGCGIMLGWVAAAPWA